MGAIVVNYCFKVAGPIRCIINRDVATYSFMTRTVINYKHINDTPFKMHVLWP